MKSKITSTFPSIILSTLNIFDSYDKMVSKQFASIDIPFLNYLFGLTGLWHNRKNSTHMAFLMCVVAWHHPESVLNSLNISKQDLDKNYNIQNMND